MISQRAKILVQNPSAIVTAAIKCAEDLYSIDNPNGYLNFGVAQNFLMENEIVNHIRENHQFETSDIHYNPLNGKESLRETFAKFAQKYLNVNDIVELTRKFIEIYKSDRAYFEKRVEASVAHAHSMQSIEKQKSIYLELFQ